MLIFCTAKKKGDCMHVRSCLGHRHDNYDMLLVRSVLSYLFAYQYCTPCRDSCFVECSVICRDGGENSHLRSKSSTFCDPETVPRVASYNCSSVHKARRSPEKCGVETLTVASGSALVLLSTKTTEFDVPVRF